MAATFQIIPLSSIDPDGSDTRNEPKLLFPDALMSAQELKHQGQAFRVFVAGDRNDKETKAFVDLGALDVSAQVDEPYA